MTAGHATPDGTARFAKAHNAQNYNTAEGLTLSNVGIGTYLGEPDAGTDELVADAIKQSVELGVNVIDTAINYRAQRAERSVGRAVSELVSDGRILRDGIFVSTKNGYVTNDAHVPGDFWQYVRDEYVKPGVVSPGDISSGYHCMTVRYLEDQLDRSLKNLDMDCVDLMYLHNGMEGQIKDITREEFLQNLRDVFEMYETKRSQGLIRFYGMATWECFRVAPGDPQYLSLSDVADMARDISGDGHGFRFVQLPFNLYYDQAYMIKNQPYRGEQVSILQAAARLGIGVFTSVPLMQGRLLQPGVMPEFSGLPPARRALQFVRSTPGVLAPLVGQKSAEHVRENLQIMDVPPIPEDEFASLVGRLTSRTAG